MSWLNSRRRTSSVTEAPRLSREGLNPKPGKRLAALWHTHSRAPAASSVPNEGGRWCHQVLRSLSAPAELCTGDAAEQTATANRCLLRISARSCFCANPANPQSRNTASLNRFHMDGSGRRDCIRFRTHSHVKTQTIRNKILWCNLDKHSDLLIIQAEYDRASEKLHHIGTSKPFLSLSQ